jgi:hypothetical protein
MMEERKVPTKKIEISFEVPDFIDRNYLRQMIQEAIIDDDQDALDWLSDYVQNVELVKEEEK